MSIAVRPVKYKDLRPGQIFSDCAPRTDYAERDMARLWIVSKERCEIRPYCYKYIFSSPAGPDIRNTDIHLPEFVVYVLLLEEIKRYNPRAIKSWWSQYLFKVGRETVTVRLP
jgi:hypothetical protein